MTFKRRTGGLLIRLNPHDTVEIAVGDEILILSMEKASSKRGQLLIRLFEPSLKRVFKITTPWSKRKASNDVE